MTAASDLQWGRQGGRIGDFRRSTELLADIAKERRAAGTIWPTHPDHQAAGEPRCDTCKAATTILDPIGRGRHCQTCAPAVWAGLARMADARRHAGHDLDIWDQRALMRASREAA
jgi:hypothetical protein